MNNCALSKLKNKNYFIIFMICMLGLSLIVVKNPDTIGYYTDMKNPTPIKGNQSLKILIKNYVGQKMFS
jgi:hypothetical protein